MGFAKNRYMEQSELGFYAPESRAVCSGCVTDYALKELIEAHAEATTCEFCGSSEDRFIAAETDIVLEHMARSLATEWDDALNAVPWEGGWQGGVSIYNISEVLAEEGWPFANEKFRRFVVEAFGDREWSQRDPFALSKVESLDFSWDLFGDTVKHEARFLFLMLPEDSSADGAGEPLKRGGAMLAELGRLVTAHGLVREIKAGTEVVRVRLDNSEDALGSAARLGSPPPCKASQNRMSPAGISMFCGSEAEETSLAELFAADRDRKPVTGIATFRTSAACRVIDLSQLPPVPSIFDDAGLGLRAPLGFLHGFRRDVSAPIEFDERIHIEYVPTQIVSEYFRLVFKDGDGVRPMGLIYPSAQHQGGTCVVLFVGPGDCLDPGEDPDGDRFQLQLCEVRHEATENLATALDATGT